MLYGFANTPEEPDFARVRIAPIDTGLANRNEPALLRPGFAPVIRKLERILSKRVHPFPGVASGGTHLLHVLSVVGVENVDTPIVRQVGHDPRGLRAVGGLNIDMWFPRFPAIGTAAGDNVLSFLALMTFARGHGA